MASGFAGGVEDDMGYLMVAIGGALGSVARYGCSSIALRWFGVGFPYGTLFVNVVGSYLIGLLGTIALAGGRTLSPLEIRVFLISGFLGGFTTFSAFSLETFALARGGNFGSAAANILLSLVLCFAAVWLGYASATAFAR